MLQQRFEGCRHAAFAFGFRYGAFEAARPQSFVPASLLLFFARSFPNSGSQKTRTPQKAKAKRLKQKVKMELV